MPEGDTIHRAARRIEAALVGSRIVEIETPQPLHRNGDDNRTTYWCPGCQG
jgi:formamidopyrimidine-DNA glycosylase